MVENELIPYLKRRNINIENPMRYGDFLKLLTDVANSSTLPVMILQQREESDLITFNTSLFCMCTSNRCASKFNTTALNLLNNYLKWKTCCPRCINSYKKAFNEELNKLKKDDAFTEGFESAETWQTEKEFDMSYKIVDDPDNPGHYITVKLSPKETEERIREREEQEAKLAEEIAKDPSLLEKLKEKDNKPKVLSREEKVMKEIERSQNKTDAPVSDSTISLESHDPNANAFEEKRSRELSSDDIEIKETTGENISKDAVWDDLNKYNPIHNHINGNPYKEDDEVKYTKSYLRNN